MFSFHFSQDIKSLLSPLLQKRLLSVFCRRINENNILDPSIGKIKNSAGVYWMNYIQALFFNGVLENSVILPSILKPQCSNSILCVLLTHWVLSEWLLTVQCDCLYLVYLLWCYSISLASPVLGYHPPQWREHNVRDFFF